MASGGDFYAEERAIRIIYVDMDDVLCGYTDGHSAALSANPDVEFPQRVPGFFLSLVPIENAISSVNKLRERFDVYVLTAPSTRNPHCYSEKRIWVEQHFDYEFTKKLIINPNKGLMIGDYLIDDHAYGKGQDSFQGELIQFGSNEFPSWNAVLAYLDGVQ